MSNEYKTPVCLFFPPWLITSFYCCFSVYAKDGAYPARYDVATIIINVADANDHSPTFASDTYSLVLPENQAPSTLHTVVAQDNDVGINAKLTYTIIGRFIDRGRYFNQ